MQLIFFFLPANALLFKMYLLIYLLMILYMKVIYVLGYQ